MLPAHLALIAVSIIYGLFYVAIKLVTQEIDPLDVFCLRVMGATPILIIAERIFVRSRITRWQDWLAITGLGLLGVTLVQSTVIVGIKYTSVFHTGMITGLAPLFTLIFSLWLNRDLAARDPQERITPQRWLGVFVAFGGLALLLTSKTHLDPHLASTAHNQSTLGGDAIILFNIIIWALFLLLSKRLMQRFHPFTLTAYSFGTSTLVTLPYLIWALEGNWPGAALSATGWQWIAFIVLVSTALSYALYFYGLSKLPASITALYVYLQPIMTTIFGVIILHEVVTPMMGVYAAIILLGVAIANGTLSISQWLARGRDKEAVMDTIE